MYSFYFLNIICFASSFVLHYAVATNSNRLKEVFKNVQGDLAITRDFCLKDSSITIDDLKIYDDNEQVPENYSCFFKCLYRQLEIIDADGELDVDALDMLPGFDKSKFGEVKKCMKSFGKIITCNDLKRAGVCLHLGVAI